jgi:hypothetical protein
VLLWTQPRGGAGVASIGLASIITTRVDTGLLLCLAFDECCDFGELIVIFWTVFVR